MSLQRHEVGAEACDEAAVTVHHVCQQDALSERLFRRYIHVKFEGVALLKPLGVNRERAHRQG